MSPIERRVLGVLVEKARTTDTYPLTVNSLKAGCNQKSNRHPSMDLDETEIEDTLERLRERGAVIEVFDSGRAAKYKHDAYTWFNVSSPEMAVLAELMLRGPQSVGDLRGRAARMEKSLTDVSALKPLVQSLQEKGLLLALTPEGRGQIVTHNLYPPAELAAVKSQVASQPVAPEPMERGTPAASPTSAPRASNPQPTTFVPTAASVPDETIEELRTELASLRSQLQELKRDFEQLSEHQAETAQQLDRLKQDLGV
jgi:uncharacterized protein YceH (UPF0502 family)